MRRSKSKQWIADQGLTVGMVSLAFADDAIADRYIESSDPGCNYWKPEKPEDEGWFGLSMNEIDDLPVFGWVRREVAPCP